MKLGADRFEVEGRVYTRAELRAEFPAVPWEVLRTRASRENATRDRLGAPINSRFWRARLKTAAAKAAATSARMAAESRERERLDALGPKAFAAWRAASRPAPFGLVAGLRA